MSELRLHRDTGSLTADLYDYSLAEETPVLTLHARSDAHFGPFSAGGTTQAQLAAELRGIGEAALHAAQALSHADPDTFTRLLGLLDQPQSILADLTCAGGRATNPGADSSLLTVLPAPRQRGAWVAITETNAGNVRTTHHPHLSVGIGGPHLRLYLGDSEDVIGFDLHDPRDPVSRS